jgi:hypothetical protein
MVMMDMYMLMLPLKTWRLKECVKASAGRLSGLIIGMVDFDRLKNLLTVLGCG